MDNEWNRETASSLNQPIHLAKADPHLLDVCAYSGSLIVIWTKKQPLQIPPTPLQLHRTCLSSYHTHSHDFQTSWTFLRPVYMLLPTLPATSLPCSLINGNATNAVECRTRERKQSSAITISPPKGGRRRFYYQQIAREDGQIDGDGQTEHRH